MKVFKGLNNLPPFRNAVATMGSFDGVHSGHRELLHRVASTAAASDGESIVLTFEPHPRYVLGSGDGLRLLSTLDEKLWLLERSGIDNVIVLPFTVEFSRTSPREFIENDIAGIGIRRLVVGYNHRFGPTRRETTTFWSRALRASRSRWSSSSRWPKARSAPPLYAKSSQAA